MFTREEKVKTKVFHQKSTHSSCVYILNYLLFVSSFNKALENDLSEVDLLNGSLTFSLNYLLLHTQSSIYICPSNSYSAVHFFLQYNLFDGFTS